MAFTQVYIRYKTANIGGDLLLMEIGRLGLSLALFFGLSTPILQASKARIDIFPDSDPSAGSLSFK